MSKVSKYRSLQKSEKLLFREAFWKMFIVRIQLRIRSFKHIANELSKTQANNLGEQQELRAIRRAINRAHRLWKPKNSCLVNTLTAKKMLNNRKLKSEASLGVKKNESGKLIAHAWIHSNGVEIVAKGDNYKELHQF